MNIGVVVFPGSNCDHDCQHIFKDVLGQNVEMIWHKETSLVGLDAIILPVSGKGLWSTCYGYLALAGDKNTVKGIQFYRHGETPGLGGEIENANWTAMWKGKQILNDKGELVSVTVKKGKVDQSKPVEKKHFVDGLAGATITSNGVSKFVLRDLKALGTYLQKK